ncbi:PLAC8 family-domain-containing protein [Cantharellus anzutake]|uniref:PLAC8 family-domain-containing protein n=1 Tax=Cantharellus anzutake TaxID=1750568 RepID=UPI0019048C3D|nr:PLAC8 family-domain-containing protein [Cantharellus anzutake]KAF8325756.1 PLAC8 family-domain-containing protein [Cantharellus anzutake]
MPEKFTYNPPSSGANSGAAVPSAGENPATQSPGRFTSLMHHRTLAQYQEATPSPPYDEFGTQTADTLYPPIGRSQGPQPLPQSHLSDLPEHLTGRGTGGLAPISSQTAHTRLNPTRTPFQARPVNTTYISQQPSTAPQMAISGGEGLGGNRNALGKPLNGPAGHRDWSFGLCDFCGACQTCLFAFCCPCFAYGQNMSRLKYLKNQGTPHPEGGTVLNAESVTYYAFMHLYIPGCYSMIGRREVRKRYNIEGNLCTDCLTQCFCSPCSITQESREIELEEQTLFPRVTGARANQAYSLN